MQAPKLTINDDVLKTATPEFAIDEVYDDGDGDIEGILHLPISAAETIDRDGDMIPFHEQEKYLSRVVEIIQKGYDPFDIDHEVTKPGQLKRIGDGALGRFILLRAYTTIENGVPVAKVALKLRDRRGRDLARKVIGTSLAAKADIYDLQ